MVNPLLILMVNKFFKSTFGKVIGKMAKLLAIVQQQIFDLVTSDPVFMQHLICQQESNVYHSRRWKLIITNYRGTLTRATETSVNCCCLWDVICLKVHFIFVCLHFAGRCGLMVEHPPAVWEDPSLNLTAGSAFHDSHCDIQPWARVVHRYCSA